MHSLGPPRHRTAVFVSFFKKPTVEKPVNSFWIFYKREPVPCSEPDLRLRGRNLGFVTRPVQQIDQMAEYRAERRGYACCLVIESIHG
jgi:hypothetical protein